jgi:competence protein CoiA
MQLRARSFSGELVFSHQARKQLDYVCLECGATVRLRGGIHRQKHFYHVKPPEHCRQNGKSMEHLMAQHYLKGLFGDECSLEHPFPAIARIADCAWHTKKIIFEIQCSFISQAEVFQRNADYASVGYQVVWLLDDRRYNQRLASAAELWLQGHPHYFVHFSENGPPVIYDQLDCLHKGMRHKLLKKVSVNIQELRSPAGSLLGFHRPWAIHFKDDWLDRATEEEMTSVRMHTSAKPLDWTAWTASIWMKGVIRPYRILFAYLLEKACR